MTEKTLKQNQIEFKKRQEEELKFINIDKIVEQLENK